MEEFSRTPYLSSEYLMGLQTPPPQPVVRGIWDPETKQTKPVSELRMSPQKSKRSSPIKAPKKSSSSNVTNVVKQPLSTTKKNKEKNKSKEKQEEEEGVVLSLDEVAYDRDLKWYNRANHERVRPSLDKSGKLYSNITNVTQNTSEYHSLDNHYRELDKRKVTKDKEAATRTRKSKNKQHPPTLQPHQHTQQAPPPNRPLNSSVVALDSLNVSAKPFVPSFGSSVINVAAKPFIPSMSFSSHPPPPTTTQASASANKQSLDQSSSPVMESFGELTVSEVSLLRQHNISPIVKTNQESEVRRNDANMREEETSPDNEDRDYDSEDEEILWPGAHGLKS